MPFAALEGYYDLVRDQERVVEPRRELTDEEVARISHELAVVRRGDLVRVTHYVGGAYVTQEGVVSEIDVPFHVLQVVRTRIRFEDLWSVEVL
jgi:hypothetical protein